MRWSQPESQRTREGLRIETLGVEEIARKSCAGNFVEDSFLPGAGNGARETGPARQGQRPELGAGGRLEDGGLDCAAAGPLQRVA